MNHNAETADVVIIGGSAAGLFAAYELARAGTKVKLFDVGDPLQVASRTLIATSQLSEILGFSPHEAIVNEIRQIDLFAADRSVTVHIKQPDLVVERARIIELLANKATQAGAEIRCGFKFVGFEGDGNSLRIAVRNGQTSSLTEIRARTLIGADGAFSRVAKIAERNGKRTVPILQAVVPLPRAARHDAVRVWFDPHATPYFIWLIPKSAEHAAVGLIGEDGRATKNALEQFLTRHSLKPLEIQAARIPLYDWTCKPWRKISNTEVYLVGDAAGQVKVTTVGGLVTGLWGAKAAANAVLRRGDYERELRPLKRELTLHLIVRSILNRFSAQDYNRLLHLLDDRILGLLSTYSRDRLAKFFLRLVIAQPRFVSFGARLLLPRPRKSGSKTQVIGGPK